MFDKMIRRLVKLVEESDIAQLEFSSWGRKIKITKRYDTNGYNYRGGAPTEIVLPAHNPAPALFQWRQNYRILSHLHNSHLDYASYGMFQRWQLYPLRKTPVFCG